MANVDKFRYTGEPEPTILGRDISPRDIFLSAHEGGMYGLSILDSNGQRALIPVTEEHTLIPKAPLLNVPPNVNPEGAYELPIKERFIIPVFEAMTISLGTKPLGKEEDLSVREIGIDSKFGYVVISESKTSHEEELNSQISLHIGTSSRFLKQSGPRWNRLREAAGVAKEHAYIGLLSYNLVGGVPVPHVPRSARNSDKRTPQEVPLILFENIGNVGNDAVLLMRPAG